MSDIHTRKVAEGDAALAKAKKLEKPTLFRWKADYEKASESYEEAGNAYKAAKAHDKASEAFAGAATCYEKMDELFRAGRSFDLAATMAKETKDMDRTAEYYSKASYAYRMHGNSDKGADMMFKAAKALEEVDEKRALEKYVEACDLFQTEGKDFYSGECFRSTIAFCLKIKAFDQAIAMMVRQIDVFRRNDQRSYLNKAILSIIIIDLYGDDFVRAELDFRKYSEEISSFPGSDEHKVASSLIEAFETRDQAALQKAIKNPVVNFLEQQIIKIAKTLNVDSSSNTSPKLPQTSLAPPKQEAITQEKSHTNTSPKPASSSAIESNTPVETKASEAQDTPEPTLTAAPAVPEVSVTPTKLDDSETHQASQSGAGAGDDSDVDGDFDDYGGNATSPTAPKPAISSSEATATPKHDDSSAPDASAPDAEEDDEDGLC